MDDARALYREVLERSPEDKEVLTLRASVAGSPEESLAYLLRALQDDPMYVPAQQRIIWAMCDLVRRAELVPLARTWLAQPPAPGAHERFQVALDHARLALRLQGDTRRTVIEFRKHLGWYTKGLHGASDLRQRLFQIESVAEAEAIFLEYLDPVAHVA